MSPRADPERIHEAQRAGVTRRLTLDGLSADHAVEWIVRWERSEASQGIPQRGGAYWDAAWAWLEDERGHR